MFEALSALIGIAIGSMLGFALALLTLYMMSLYDPLWDWFVGNPKK